MNIIGDSSGNCTANTYISLYDTDGMTPLFSNQCGELPYGALYTASGDSLTLEIESAGGAGMIINFTVHYTSYYVGKSNITQVYIFLCTPSVTPLADLRLI